MAAHGDTHTLALCLGTHVPPVRRPSPRGAHPRGAAAGVWARSGGCRAGFNKRARARAVVPGAGWGRSSRSKGPGLLLPLHRVSAVSCGVKAQSCKLLPCRQAVYAESEGAVLSHKFSTFCASQKLGRSGRDFLLFVRNLLDPAYPTCAPPSPFFFSSKGCSLLER